MHDDDFEELRASLALVRLAWPQLVTMFGFLFAVLLRYPTWFVALSVLAVTVSILHVAMNVARNPARSFDCARRTPSPRRPGKLVCGRILV
ncbi:MULTISPECIES: hypothetical protein [Paraburkholderia]|uniref:Uncharacterized protein n=1 Tax=Paraburkholderia unamae TaxID=219649 RepID=A0ACC6RFF9_9BURK